MKKVLELLFKSHFSILKTIWINFKVLPVKEAIKLPIWLYGKTRIISMPRGCVKFLCPVGHGILRIGGSTTQILPHYHASISHINICGGGGNFVVGSHVVLSNGIYLAIANGAKVQIGNNCNVNINSKIYCERSIMIGDDFSVGWECQIMDTDFHYVAHNGVVRPRSASIKIGDRCWLGNRVSLLKGTVLPGNTIVGSMSQIGMDCTRFGNGAVLSGIGRIMKLAENSCRLFGNNDAMAYFIVEHQNEGMGFDEITRKLKEAQKEHSTYTTVWNMTYNY